MLILRCGVRKPFTVSHTTNTIELGIADVAVKSICSLAYTPYVQYCNTEFLTQRSPCVIKISHDCWASNFLSLEHSIVLRTPERGNAILILRTDLGCVSSTFTTGTVEMTTQCRDPPVYRKGIHQRGRHEKLSLPCCRHRGVGMTDERS